MSNINEAELVRYNQEPFVRASHTMETIREQIPGVEPVTLNDIDLFNRFFQAEEAIGRQTHGNGFSYMLQMMNSVGVEGQPRVGYKYFDGANLIPIVAYPLKSDPQQLGIYLIRPMGNNAIEASIDIAQRIRSHGHNQPIFAKKVFPDQAVTLIEGGFGPIETFPWHPLAPREDDTLPEAIYDVNYTLNPPEVNSSAKKLRQQIRKAEQLTKTGNVAVTEDGFMDNAWSITQRFFEIPSKRKVNLSSPFDYYNLIFHNPDRQGLTRRIMYVEGQPVGYYVAEAVPGSDYTNFYALVTLKDEHPYSADYLSLHALRNAETRYFNMGGAEEPGIFKFKQKYLPTKLQQMEWVVKLD